MDGQEEPGKSTSSLIQACAQDLSSDSTQENLAGRENNGAVGTAITSPSTLFPAVTNAYGQWGIHKGFHLCGATEQDRLCYVDIHTGYSRNGPLGTRPGIVLHNGRSSKTPVLAAAGYDSKWSARIYSFNNESLILMPSLLPATARTSDFVPEQMPATVRRGQVVFPFGIEVDYDKKAYREKFEWRKFDKGVDPAAKEGGFKLVQLPSARSTKLEDELGSSSPDSDGEVLALLVWRKLFPTFKHVFTLQLVGRGQSGELGERWTLMVVITALRLWTLRVNGKTKRCVIAAGQ